MALFGPSKPPPATPSPKLARVLFLDDDPLRAHDFLGTHPEAVWVQTVEDCLAQLEGPWDEVHLDHDLGGEHFVDPDREDCGMAVVRWLVAMPRPHLRRTRFLVHSHNANAATLMGFRLSMSGYTVEIQPFGLPAEPPTPDQELQPPHRASLSKAIVNLILRILGRKPDVEDYGYTEYPREGPDDPEVQPLERPDFSWTRVPPAGADLEPPDE